MRKAAIICGALAIVIAGRPALAIQVGSSNCTGASILPGSTDTAGRVIMGPNNAFGLCTLIFSSPAQRVCWAKEELTDGHAKSAGGNVTSNTTMDIGDDDGTGWTQGNYIEYGCQLIDPDSVP